MRYAGLNKNDFVNGEGVSVSLFTQGCPHHCPGCFNPETWAFDGGIEIEENVLIAQVIAALDANGIHRNLSILGGEPLCPENMPFVIKLIDEVLLYHPATKIYVWTGYERHELKDNPLLDSIDVLICGRYQESLRDITLPLRGSSNQEVIRK